MICKCCKCCSPLSIDERIKYICENEYEYFLSKNNVVGIGLGYKLTKGYNTSEKCIKVFASKKVGNDEIPEADLVPPIYKGIKTDVVQSGNIKFTELLEKKRPVPGGYSIGIPLETQTGTMGCLVTDGSDIFVLGNNHVLSDMNFVPLGTPVMQPGPEDGGKVNTDTIAKLAKYIPIKFNKKENYVDAAIAKVTDKNLVSASIAFVGYLKGIGKPNLEEGVKKVGRTTELTVGKISAIYATYVLKYNDKDVLFKDQIFTTDMADYGDSGAILVDYKNYALGLLMAGSESFTIYNDIYNVLGNLKVNILSK
ncbi:hypothetical protein CLOHAE12215_02171 [Clostridium haemolyticum]|uniref:S1 family peptidase n=1 Tax=Clostridium haemolyticum TaxID=84025 RepID=UPI001C3BCAE3|nr:S1 family peptidase [Clostridium haemolyticum]CAG7840747.1 hypothetical protein CLOHAE12215_02171 [Clostridium haemolyticum]